MIDYTGNVLGAIDLIVQERMKDLKFDKTIVCTIVENKGDGVYSVKDDGETIFEVTSETLSYTSGMKVNVLIPQGDYNNQKVITGRYISSANEITKVRYMKPFDNCLDVTGNLIPTTKEYSLLANDSNRLQTKAIWEKVFTDQDIDGYEYLGLSADFLAALSEFNPIQGSYGLHLVINAIKQNSNNKPIDIDYYLDSSDMYGNPYLFETYFNQEKIFDISNLQKINSMTLYFYQTNNFRREIENEDGVKIEDIPINNGEDIFGKTTSYNDNLKVKNFYLFLGYGLDKFEKDTVLLFTSNGLTYDNRKPDSENIKKIQARWIRNKDGNAYVLTEEMITPSIRVHWYQYNQEAEGDPIAGDGWVEISDSFGKLIFENFLPDSSHKNEEIIKVIITEGEFDETFSIEEENVVATKYESNELKFTSVVKLPDSTTIDSISGLKFKFINDTYQGNYRIYGEDKQLKNISEASRVRGIIPVLTKGEEEIELTSEDIITWKVPNTATMISLFSQKNTTEGIFDIVNRTGSASNLEFKIKRLWLETNINNTIECQVIHQGVTYSATTSLYFGATGTAGTDYTFVIEPKEGTSGIYLKGSRESIELVAKLYDYNDEPVEWTNENIKWEIPNYLFSGPENNSGVSITLTPKDEGADFAEKNYYYNLIKATVTTPITYKTSIRKKDENGNYIDKDGNIIEPNEVTGELDASKIVWEESETEPRNVSMVAYYAVPVRTNDSYYISGATSIMYDSSGADPIYEKGEYRIYGVDNKTPIWEVTYTDKEKENSSAYVPQIIKTKDTGYQLRPKKMFIQDLPEEIAIKCYYEEEEEKEDKTIEIKKYLLWAQPLIIRQNQYSSSLLNQWDGSLTIDENNGTILSTMVGAGKKNSDNTFSGVLMGDVEKGSGDSAIRELGLYGFHHGAQSFGFKVDGTAFLGKSDTGRIDFDGNKGIIKSAIFNKETEKGMQIDLKEGTIESYQFTLKATGTDKEQEVIDKENILGYENIEKEVEVPVYDENGKPTGEIKTEIITIQEPIYGMKKIPKIDTKIRLSNISPYFEIKKINYNEEGNIENNVNLIYIANNDYYLQSENFVENSIHGSLSANGIKISLKDGESAIKTNGFLLEAKPTNGNKNKMLINSSATSYPFEIGYLSGNSITSGFRIGWGGITQWGDYNNPGVTIQGSGITIGDESLDTYVRSIVTSYGYATKSEIPDVSIYVTKDTYRNHTHQYSYAYDVPTYPKATSTP